jgi:predicted nucleic acid-binding protein
MSNMFVIDTSVAVKWFVQHEKKKEQADQILSQIEKNPNYFIVPELFFNEMLAVFCKLSKDPAVITNNMELLSHIGIQRIGNGRDLISEAADLACRFSLTGYDAIFAATAKLLNAVWITADEKAYKKISSQKYVELL